MAVALGTTLINLNIRTMIYKGPAFSRIEDGYTNGTDIFIGAIVSKKGETQPDIDLCDEDDAPFGMVLGYTNRDEPDSTGYYYRDYDVPFADGKWVHVGILTPGQILWFCSATNETISRGDYLKVVDGVLEVASTGDDYIAIAEEAVTGAASTRKYFRARVVKS